ncbi:MAG: DRTGG domain-containing protein [Halanaerobiaceae bacterium]
MKVNKLVQKLDLEVVVGADLEREVKGGYTGDLLSNVMARATAGDIWITIQGHQNVAAVALLADVAGVIVAEDFNIEEETKQRAQEKGINLFHSSRDAFELVGKIYELGVRS